MRRFALILAIFALSCADRDPPIGHAAQTIIDGDLEMGFPAVGALVSTIPDRDPSGSFCSATLIDPSWVLTAAHCIVGGQSRVPDSAPPSEAFHISFFIGTDAGQAKMGQLAAGRRAYIHPSYAWEGASRLYDIALLELETPVTNVEPIRIRRDAIPTGLGSLLFFVGFGQSNADGSGSGVKRSATLALDSIAPVSLIVSQSQGGVCFGDSGGPSLFDANGTWEVAGVNSTVSGDPACFGYATQIRVDTYRSWIDSVMQNGASPSCIDDGSICSCAEACGVDGVCDNARCGEAGCENLSTCLRRCTNNGCAVRCLARANPEANHLFLALNDCITERCPSRATACIESECRRDLIGCENGLSAVTGDASCGEIFRCAEPCAADDVECVDSCFFEGTLETQAELETIERCVEVACPELEPKSQAAIECRAHQCREPLLACMPDETCRIVGGSCDPGSACLPQSWSATYCVPTIGVAIGEDCDIEFPTCVDGAVCIPARTGAKCREVCATAADCRDSYAPCTPAAAMGLPFSLGVCNLACPDTDQDGACDADDCAPFDAAVSPFAPELCDEHAFDENCDGRRNEGCTVDEPAPLPQDGCTCTSTTSRPGWWLLFVPMLFLRRRLWIGLLLATACSFSEPPSSLPTKTLRDSGVISQDGAVEGPPTIFAIQQGEIAPGTRVLLEDVVVTTPEDVSGFFISDGTSGAYSGLFVRHERGLPDPIVKMGDLISIRGVVHEQAFTSTVGRGSTRTELEVAARTDIELRGSTALPEPVPVTTLALGLSEVAELYEGVVIALDNVTVTDRDMSESTLVLDELVQLDDLFVTIEFAWVEPGARFTSIVGALHYTEQGWVILPRVDEDLVRAPIDPLGCLPTGGYTICTARVNYDTARRHCAAQGGRLPVLETDNENIALGARSRVWMDRAFWIGVNDIAVEGEWIWVDGSTLTYDPWGPGEPNNAGSGEDCAHNNWRGNGVWNDANCLSRQPYACEFPGDGARCTNDDDCLAGPGRCRNGDCIP